MVPTTSVSVVIPLFNKGNCIERAVRSVLGQTVPCREIVVIDDGSTDHSLGVVRTIEDGRIRLLCQENRGLSMARNRGIDEAHGELIAFLDADDEWKPCFLESILRLWAKHPEAGAYATAYEIQAPDGHVYAQSYRGIPPTPWEGIIPNYFRCALWHDPVWSSAVAIRREVFHTVGHFTLCPGVGEDVELWGRIALRYPIAFSWHVGAVYHQEAENRLCETVFTHVFASDSFEQALRDLDPAPHLLPDIREFVAKERLVAAARYILDGQSQRGRNLLKNCKTRRFLPRKLWWWFWSLLPNRVVRFAWHSKRWLRTCLRVWSRRLRLRE